MIRAARRMPKDYARIWLGLAALSLGSFLWFFHGRAWVRRALLQRHLPSEAERTSTYFVALLFPRISEGTEDFAMRKDDFEALLSGIAANGHRTIGLKDLKDFYFGGRLLPRRAVLIALDRDEPRSVRFADETLRKLKLKGVIFLTKEKSRVGNELRHSLSTHAVKQLLKSGAWELGWSAFDEPEAPIDDSRLQAVLDSDGMRAWTKNPARYPFRFVSSKTGFNDETGKASEVRMMRLKPERTPEENLRLVEDNWPRTEEFVDDFKSGSLSLDWAPLWGVVATGKGYMTLLPTPRQTSATVALRGTELWRDMILEFELRKQRQSFWAYARNDERGRFVRIGVADGRWQVQQKSGPDKTISVLASMPYYNRSPARARIILKGDSAMLHLGDRMQFGKALRLHPDIDRGRVQFTVYDVKPKAALASLSYVRAAPLVPKWIALKGATSDPGVLDRLRAEALYARALSPHWLRAESGGKVTVDRSPELELIRSLAGFYRCRLVPTADLTALGPSSPGTPETAERLASELSGAVSELRVSGLNLRLWSRQAGGDGWGRFVEKLRRSLHAQRQELWITLAGDLPEGAEVRLRADGFLRVLKDDPQVAELIEVPKQEERGRSGHRG